VQRDISPTLNIADSEMEQYAIKTLVQKNFGHRFAKVIYCKVFFCTVIDAILHARRIIAHGNFKDALSYNTVYDSYCMTGTT